MAHTHETSYDGYEAFSEISDATIASVRRDMTLEPRDVLRLFKELSAVNSDVSLAVLAEARQTTDTHSDAELAFIQGATFILRLLVKEGKARKLHNMLLPDCEAPHTEMREKRAQSQNQPACGDSATPIL